MSELDLIKKLERLSDVKPNKEWVKFTRESILSSTPELQKQGFFEGFHFKSLAPMMACVFGALIFGTLINTQEKEMIAEIDIPEEMTASIIDIVDIEEVKPANLPQKKELPIIATNDIEEEDDLILDEQSLAVILNEADKETVIKQINSRLERVKNEVKECKRLGELLIDNEEAKERCANFENQLNTFEQYLREEDSETR